MSKFLQIKDNKDFLVNGPFGWKSFSGIGKTKYYKMYLIELEDKTELKAADNHYILTDSGFKQCKDLYITDHVITKNKIQKIIRLSLLNNKEQCYELLDVSNGVYYTNNIISHNSTTIAVFVLHYAIFNKDKTIGIVSNKLKSAKEILKRIKIMYEELPEYIKPGVVTYSKTEIEFENGSSIITSATSEDALRGHSINILVCLEKNENVTVLSKITGQVKNITLNDLFNELLQKRG